MDKIKKLTIEDIFLYGYLSFFIISFLVFFIGFFWAVKIDFNDIEVSTNIRKLLSGDYDYLLGDATNSKNLFELNRNIANDTGIESVDYSSILSMSRCSIAGFSLIMISLGIFVGILIVTSIIEIFVSVKKKKSK